MYFPTQTGFVMCLLLSIEPTGAQEAIDKRTPVRRGQSHAQRMAGVAGAPRNADGVAGLGLQVNHCILGLPTSVHHQAQPSNIKYFYRQQKSIPRGWAKYDADTLIIEVSKLGVLQIWSCHEHHEQIYGWLKPMQSQQGVCLQDSQKAHMCWAKIVLRWFVHMDPSPKIEGIQGLTLTSFHFPCVLPCFQHAVHFWMFTLSQTNITMENHQF